VFLLSESYHDLIDSVSGNIYPFRPGMSATVDIQTETRDNVISVPISAVTTRIKKEGGGTEEVKDENVETTDNSNENVAVKEEKQEVVFVLNGDRVKKVEVKTGIQDNNSIEILEGINVGDEVIIAPYNAINKTLKDSMQVKVVDEAELYKVKK
jgi:HlyD family secretion protein